jgi:IMP dehydrogenase
MVSKDKLPFGLTFDDVLLTPGYSDFSRADIKLDTRISKNITLKIPLISSPMDTVTGSKLAIALARLGGIGIIHRNLSIVDQAHEVALVKENKLLVGAAIGVSDGYKERLQALVKAKVDVIVLDSAHGWTNKFIEAARFIKKAYPKLDLIIGNIATYDAAVDLIRAGADGLRVGMGPGAICTTRVISGMGVPQITAVSETVKAARKSKIPVIADGGIKYSGDIVKALSAGASTVMMGSIFASTEESPGEVFELKSEQVPLRFKSILKKDRKVYKFKTYRGMGSVSAMKHGAKIKSEDEYHGKSYKDKILVAEGVEGMVPIKGKLEDTVSQLIGGIKSGMYYVGAQSIPELQSKARFIQITQASLTESHPHEVLITNPGENY